MADSGWTREEEREDVERAGEAIRAYIDLKGPKATTRFRRQAEVALEASGAVPARLVRELVGALRKRGHRDTCAMYRPSSMGGPLDCDCGLDTALTSVRPYLNPEEAERASGSTKARRCPRHLFVCSPPDGGRLVRCRLPVGHEGDHETVADTREEADDAR